ncbi:hypothetical protein CYY_004259 [Polysphondylium violaceum]|uniref:Cytochrome b-c1 complex subunit 7 n=1 Tax=Polysphondylium violaceum TaxID=133409 RepID=A0A8J4Q5R2_9MYCE|nr:hypothetical protein CYY_004259 [Polysphondylium violaceum]
MNIFKLLPESFVTKLQKSSWMEHRKLGLFYADLYNSTPVIEEVYSRLPDNVLAARDRRLRIAIDLSVKKQTLPEPEWSDLVADAQYTKMIESYAESVQKEHDLRKSFRD